MRGVFRRNWRAAAACLLIIVLSAPVAFASDTDSDSSFWTELIAWFTGQVGTVEGDTTPDESRFGIPGG